MNQRGGAIAVSTGILLSRITGLLREAVVRGRLGLGIAGDAYTAALRIPNLLQNLLGEGVLSGSFIPVYSGIVDEDPEEAGRLAGAVATFLVLVAAPIVALGVLFAEPITRALLFGRAPENTELTVDLVRIMTPGIGVLVLSAWSLGVLNSHRQFFLAYAAPMIWNLTQISVVIAAGTLYFGSSADDKLYALDAASGRLKWTFFTDGPVRFAPAFWQDRIYVVSDDGYLYCLAAADGSLLRKWRGGPVDDRVLGNGRIVSRWPARGGPVILDGVLYWAAGIWQSEGVFIHALDLASGQVVWTNDDAGGITMPQPHAELCKRAQKSQFFGW